jgi:hypothetical protein
VHPNNRVAFVDNEEDVMFVSFLRLPNSKNTAKELAGAVLRPNQRGQISNGEFTSWVDISSVLTGKDSRA